MWALLGLLAAVFLGIYDLFKKMSVQNNAVLPVLFFSVLSGALIMIPVIIGSQFFPDFFQSIYLYVPEITVKEHGQIFLKSSIVVFGWVFAFFAMKNLPITIVSPIRATGLMWTTMGAFFIYGERLNTFQITGLLVTFLFFYLFSTIGKLEGIKFTKNKWVLYIIIATLLGACSGLYDKYLMRRIDYVAVQAWFTVYQLVIMSVVMLLFSKRIRKTKFEWRWSIPLIGIFLLITDYIYFYALTYDNVLISVLSGIRRCGVVFAFVIGGKMFKEKNIVRKGLYLLGILTGSFLMIWGSNL